MITKTIGVGGDFADLGLAWSWIWTTLCGGSNFTHMPDDVTLSIISDFTENTGMYLPGNNTIGMYGKSISIVNAGKFLSTFANDTIFHYCRSTVGTTADIFNVNGLRILAPLSDAIGILCFVAGNSGNRVTTNYSNIEIIGQDVKGTNIGIQLSNGGRSAETTMINCKIYNVGNGILFNDAIPSVIANKIENCTIYGCTNGIYLNYSNVVGKVTTIKNTVCSGCTKDFNILTNTYNVILNSADSDGSILTSGGILSYNVTSITDADYLSVSVADDNFLNIDQSSKLYETGTSALLANNTADIDGNPRPHGFHNRTSIGAYEGMYAVPSSDYYIKTNTVEISKGLVQSWNQVVINRSALLDIINAHTANNNNPHQVTVNQLFPGTLPVYADNQAAIAGGLSAGKLYRTGSDPDPVCVVH